MVEKDRKRTSRAGRIPGVAGILTGLLLLPPLFAHTLSVAPLRPGETAALWLFALSWMGVSLVIFFKGTALPRIMALFITFSLLLSAELGVRLYVNIFQPGDKIAWNARALFTDPEYQKLTGHPFTHYVPVKPRVDYARRAKAEGVMRVACLGGSTTIRGYPKSYPEIMEAFLNRSLDDPGDGFEVLNFGVTGYTSNHSIVNFALNVLDYSPDYVVFHHAWNEQLARGLVPEEAFRGDYSHNMKSFQPVFVPDKYLVQASLIYRYARMKLKIKHGWMLAQAIYKYSFGLFDMGPPDRKNKDLMHRSFENEWELEPYRRNLKTLVDLAGARDITVVLTTQPHSTDPKARHAYVAPHIDQCNAIVRAFWAEQDKDRVLLADLDKAMTGKENHHFTDVGHMDLAGREMKAREIGKTIMRHFRKSR